MARGRSSVEGNHVGKFGVASVCSTRSHVQVALLAVKTGMELHLDVLTKDLVVHHVGMAAAAATAVAYPTYSSSVLFVNVIHIPLAVQYTRRLRGEKRGGALDTCFGVLWLFAVVARCAMMLAQSVRVAALPVRSRRALARTLTIYLY